LIEHGSGSIIATGGLASLAAGLATAVGALPLLGLRRPTEQQQNLLLGFAAGVMLAASFFSLIIPAIDAARAGGASAFASSTQVTSAVLVGALLIAQLNRRLPALDTLGITAPGAIDGASLRRIWLLIAAITLHNIPEGMAVGVSFGAGDFAAGRSTALGIGLQNIPEGLAVATAMTTAGYGRGKAFAAALLSGLVEPVAGVIGVSIVTVAEVLLPWGLGLAAGAMIWVVVADIIPDAVERTPGGGRLGSGLMLGLAVMMMLDTAFA
jgi:ZIP family zinc transporter